jgi:hypothetical protein
MSVMLRPWEPNRSLGGLGSFLVMVQGPSPEPGSRSTMSTPKRRFPGQSISNAETRRRAAVALFSACRFSAMKSFVSAGQTDSRPGSDGTTTHLLPLNNTRQPVIIHRGQEAGGQATAGLRRLPGTLYAKHNLLLWARSARAWLSALMISVTAFRTGTPDAWDSTQEDLRHNHLHRD